MVTRAPQEERADPTGDKRQQRRDREGRNLGSFEQTRTFNEDVSQVIELPMDLDSSLCKEPGRPFFSV
jgi:hypothetical protein